MLLKKLFAGKNRQPRTPEAPAKPGNFEVAFNPMALLVKGATRF
ncbi:MAG: hypothetical protein V3S95_00940 [Alphaproteobacteria bacterium]|jgi:hypothetical protein